MYFEDRSPNKELGYLADGLTEALIDELSAVPQLKVASRNGSAAFKGKIVPSDSIARTLKVGTVVHGTLESAGEGKVRVVLRVDDALTGQAARARRRWISPLGNSLALQDSIAHQMSIFLRKRVGQEIQDLTSKVGTNESRGVGSAGARTQTCRRGGCAREVA